ncbi:MAG: M20/M25/M40 family metallo-hydrolase [Gemmatimonadota bacterium]|nr:M20/M25/M40 family metallo-hydrolase [Gemmatimonadota bacterium]
MAVPHKVTRSHAGEPPRSSDVVELAIQLMQVESTSGGEGAAVTLVGDLLAARGWRVTRIPVSTGRDDVFARKGAGPFVTLSTHLDTVPPHMPPRVDGRRLWGRGACDAKGIAAAMICAAERLDARGVAVALLFVVGEEVSHDGAHAANQWAARNGVVSRVLVNGEPTESTLALGTKGAMRMTLRVHGVAAHSAYPNLGLSATRELARILAALDDVDLPRDEVLGDTTINIGVISGGVADNVVAPSAEARLMARTVGAPEEVLRRVRELVGDRGELHQGITAPAVRLGVLPGYPTSVVAYATDIPALGNWGTPYLFGPGSIHVAHRDDEHIEIEELRRAVETYERLAVDAMRRGE